MAARALPWRLLGCLTGGRPMQYLGHRFTDLITGRPVGLYVDTRGRRWLAEGAWSWFRIPPTDDD